MKEPVEVEILGQRLTVASDDGVDHVRDVARLVDEHLRRLVDTHASVSTLQLALLVALNMGSEVAKLRTELETLDDGLERLCEIVSGGMCFGSAEM